MVGQNPGDRDIYIYVERHPNNLISFFYNVCTGKTRTHWKHPTKMKWRKASKHYSAALEAASTEG